jgi:hypothetical protein
MALTSPQHTFMTKAPRAVNAVGSLNRCLCPFLCTRTCGWEAAALLPTGEGYFLKAESEAPMTMIARLGQEVIDWHFTYELTVL